MTCRVSELSVSLEAKDLVSKFVMALDLTGTCGESQVTEEIENLRLNTAISAMMEFINSANKVSTNA